MSYLNTISSYTPVVKFLSQADTRIRAAEMANLGKIYSKVMDFTTDSLAKPLWNRVLKPHPYFAIIGTTVLIWAALSYGKKENQTP